MKKRLLYLIPIVLIGIFLGVTFTKTKETKSQVSFLDIKLASYAEVQSGDNLVEGTDDIEFDAYFMVDVNNDGIMDGIRGICKEYNKIPQMTVELSVLRDTVITSGSITFQENNVDAYYKNNSSITLKDVDGGTNQVYKVNMSSKLSEDLASYSATNKVILDATIIKDGQESHIRKEVPFTVDWYRTSMNTSIVSPSSSIRVNDGKLIVTYDFKTIMSNSYRDRLLQIKSINLDIDVPNFNETAPSSVKANGTNINYTYDENNNKLSITREAVLEGTKIKNAAYDYISYDSRAREYDAYNSFTVTVEYPSIVGYDDASLPLTVNAWNEVYNNPGSEFENPIISSKANRIIVAHNEPADVIESINEGGPIPYYISAKSDITPLDNPVDKTPVLNHYNGIESEDNTTYSYKLYLEEIHTLGTVNKLYFWDTGYDKINGQSMESFVSYKSIKFDNNPSYYLGTGGYVKLIDADTDETIHVFTKDDWDQEYIFDTVVRRIKVETSSLDNSTPCRSYHPARECSYHTILSLIITKEMDDEYISNNYSLDTFKSFSNITYGVSTNMEAEHETTHHLSRDYIVSKNIDYIEPYSSTINIALDKRSIDTNIDSNIKLDIYNGSTDEFKKGWKDGEFIIAIPKSIINLNINNIVSNNSNVKILGYDVDLGTDINLIRIVTSSDDLESFRITVDMDVTPDPRISGGGVIFKVYGNNPYVNLSKTIDTDIYDVDNDNNTTEKINYNNTYLDLEVANEVRTITVLKIYDNENHEVGVVTPNEAEVDPVTSRDIAKVEASLVNHSDENIKDIVLMGKVGFIGNTYQLNNTELGTKFNVVMTSDGIQVPSVVADIARVYYSDQETPTQDLNDSTNNWKTKEQISNFDNVKTYMILLDDYTLGVYGSLAFTYNVRIPLDIELLGKVSYLTHGVYYKRIINNETGETRDAPPVEQRKTGITIARKYNVDLNNYKINSTRKVNNAVYELSDEEGNKRVVVTNKEGHAYIKNLYAGRTYYLKQIEVNNAYAIDSNVKTFKIINNDLDELEVGIQEGVYKNIGITSTVLTIDLENEVRYDVIVNNTDLDTDALLPMSKYKITGKGYENGKTIITNTSGEALLKGLYLNEEYQLEQVSSVSHLNIAQPVKFLLRRNPDGEVSVSKDVVLTKAYGEITKTQGEGFRYYSSDESEYNSLTDRVYDGTGVDEGYTILDLTNYYGEYKFDYKVGKNYYAQSTPGYTYKLFVFTDLNHIPDVSEIDAPYIYDAENVTQTKNNAYQYNESTGTFDIIPIEGGKKYYIYLFARHGTAYDRYDGRITFYLYQLKKNDDSTDDIVYIRQKNNVPFDDNDNILQSIVDNDTIDSPKYILNVKSKIIPTYTLEVTKVSADTKEPLSNAQYRINGEGLPRVGQFIKTDSNGKATATLQEEWQLSGRIMSFSSGYKMSINHFDYFSINSEYSIKEVVPPDGYQIDNKEIKFRLVRINDPENCTGDYNTYLANCTIDASTPYTYFIEYKDNESQFVDYEIDEVNKILKVTMYDYPLVRITKKDGETGELLPNTLFAIYSVSYDASGNEILEPAKDSKGNVLGMKISINGVDYYVSNTNEFGKINLNLSSGKYKMIEVQASDDKYDLATGEYYFNVGSTIQHEDSAISYNDSFNIEYFYRSGGTENNIITTSDGGYFYSRCKNYDDYCNNDSVVYEKVDKFGNVEWSFNNIQYPYTTADLYLYYDKGGVITNKRKEGNTRYYGNDYYHYKELRQLYEVDDGYIISHSGSGGLIKLNNNGQLQFVTSDIYNGISYPKKQYVGACRKDNGKLINFSDEFDQMMSSSKKPYDPDDPFMQRDEETYYCLEGGTYYDEYSGRMTFYNQGSNFNSVLSNYTQSNVAFDKEGNMYLIGGYGDNNNYYILSDGTVVDYYTSANSIISDYRYSRNYCRRKIKVENTPGDPSNGTHYESVYSDDYCVDYDYYNSYEGLPITDAQKYYSGHQILKFDKDGNFVAVNNLGFYYKPAIEEYNNTHGTNIEYQRYDMCSYYYCNIYNIQVMENGDLVVFHQSNGIIRLRYDETNKTYRTIFYIPYTDYYEADTKALAEGEGPFKYKWTGNIEIRTDGNKFYFMNNDYHYYSDEADNMVRDYFSDYIYEYDENGNQIQKLSVGTGIWDNHDSVITNTDEWYVGDDWYGYYGGGGTDLQYIKYKDDKYIVFLGDFKSRFANYVVPVTLSSGDVVNVEFGQDLDGNPVDRLIIYQMDKSGSIDWVNQYFGHGTYGGSAEARHRAPQLSADGKKVLFVSPYENNVILTNKESNQEFMLKGNMLVFDLIDITSAETPEAYTIEIPNKRKTFNISINSGENGQTEVFNGNNPVYVLDNEEKSVESVKYGDNSTYTIKPKGNTGYTVDKVLIDDEEYPYTVQDDGTIILDKFDNVRENKTISITFKPANSLVIVHHYKKDTTERIASDEMVSGFVNAPYETEPVYSKLYSLIKDEDGNDILPTNYKDFFAVNPIIVIYYYEENMVNLNVNYYVENTTTELAPSDIETMRLGSPYRTQAKSIPGYLLTNVIGNEEGTLDLDNTYVTYMYQEEKDSNITVKYINRLTNESIKEDTIKTVKLGSEYEIELLDIVGDYKLVDKTTNYKGVATEENIEVICYYDLRKSNITVRYINQETSKDIVDPTIFEVNIHEEYETTPKEIDNFNLVTYSSNTKGVADGEDIEVDYYYEYVVPEVKGSPQTGDNVFKYVALFFISVLSLLVLIKLKRNKQVG